MLRIYTLSLLLFVSFAAAAQSYEFSVSQETYTPLTDGTSLNDGETWDDPTYPVPLGFTFRYFETDVDTFYFDGFYGLGGDFVTEPDSVLNEDDGTVRQMLQAYVGDVTDLNYESEDSDPPSLSPITYHHLGTAPERICVVQWENAGFYDDLNADSVANYTTNFQLWLYEGSNRIEVHYGPSSQEVQDGTFGAYISLAVFKDFSWPDDDDLPTYDEAYYLTGSPADPSWEPLDNVFDDEDVPLLTAGPEPGTIYALTPANSTSLTDAFAAGDAFRVYPNPTTDRARIQLSPEVADEANALDLLDATGRRVASYRGRPASVDLGDLPTGMYYLRLTTPAGRTALRRVVKQ